jgi:peptide deformylase
MAILKIARMGHPVLQVAAGTVDDPTGPGVAHLVRDMVETLADIGGLGLAAPQVHVPLRVVIFHIPDERSVDGEGDGSMPLTVLINPVIEPLSEEKEVDWESCLSLPQLTGEVPRFTHIRYTGVGLDGAPIERVARGFHARVLQHECDHLLGVLYPMRMTDMSRFGFVEDVHRRIAAEHAAESQAESQENGQSQEGSD